MEQKVVMLMTASGAAIGAIANLQKQIDETLAEHKGWRVVSANTTMAVKGSYIHYTATLVLEDVDSPALRERVFSRLGKSS